MRTAVTGAAGFIGSHLCGHLLDSGDEVLGIDAMTEYYDPRLKERNLARLRGRAGFTFVRGDLLALPLELLLASADVVYHLAGEPGVRTSWGPQFDVYLRRNVLATQRLLEAARSSPPHKIVYASSSSVYGNAEHYPTPETVRPQPVSPYGVSKLAGEHLCELYRTAFAVPTASLRLFSVYGPRQRPDMAFARLIEAARTGAAFPLYGDGRQTRDFTFVQDVTTAMRQAALSSWTGVANVGGGEQVSMRQVLALVGEFVGPVRIASLPAPPGDARHTGADTTVARDAFGYRPRTGIRAGLAAMVEDAVAEDALLGTRTGATAPPSAAPAGTRVAR
ncbi:NAD-dependent epimerase/dehydratase family protein [Streptacidiphilus monticola]|jgi:nucleoside-diphosphate-sugar epimerase|uniref:NAD-dependent epimerase/dehydratase family protein n=1 Tax=Streptacidiphilus monticola TaxID=2161674 RepID=A0ABW1G329_9ACTN